MSNESIQKIIDETLETINKNLNELPPPANSKQIETAFNDPIKMAYTTVMSGNPQTDEERELMKEDKVKLFRMLSLALHPDKLKTSRKDFAIKFNALSKNNDDLYKIPQQIVNAHKDDVKDVISNMMSNPISATEKFLYLFMMRIVNSWSELERYPEPVKSIFRYARYLFLAADALATVITLISIGVTNESVRLLEWALLSTIIPNFYEELEKNVTTKQMAKVARDFLAEKGMDMSSETDDTAINLYLIQNHTTLPNLKSEVAGNITGLARLTILLNAFKQAITAPLPGGWNANLLSIITRAAQVILMIPVLLIAACKQLFNYATSFLLVATLTLGGFAATAIIVLSNVPLNIYDGICAIGKWGHVSPTPKKSADSTDQSTPEPEKSSKTPAPSSSSLMIADAVIDVQPITSEVTSPKIESVAGSRLSIFSTSENALIEALQVENPKIF